MCRDRGHLAECVADVERWCKSNNDNVLHDICILVASFVSARDCAPFPGLHSGRERAVVFRMRHHPLYAGLAATLLIACHSAPATTTPPPRATPPAAAAPIRTTYATGDDLIAAMHARYLGKWYTTLTFKQITSRLLPNDTWSKAVWYEAMRIPSRLRIDFDSATSGSGVIYARDSAFTVRNGKALPGQKSINPLLLLGFDVFGNDPAKTSALLKKEGFDLTHTFADTFAGRPMIVVGQRKTGRVQPKQFWVDAEHLYFVRTLEPAPRDSSKTQDVRFVNYQRLGDAWVSPRVEIHTDGKLVFHEDYSDIKANVPLDEALFDPSKWKTAKHWMTP